MPVRLLTEHHLDFLSLKGGYTGSSESTLVEMPHCWKSRAAAQTFLCLTHRKCVITKCIQLKPKLFYHTYCRKRSASFQRVVFFTFLLYISPDLNLIWKQCIPQQPELFFHTYYQSILWLFAYSKGGTS